jgi:hypothetical protein
MPIRKNAQGLRLLPDICICTGTKQYFSFVQVQIPVQNKTKKHENEYSGCVPNIKPEYSTVGEYSGYIYRYEMNSNMYRKHTGTKH